jgi:kumamolisin
VKRLVWAGRHPAIVAMLGAGSVASLLLVASGPAGGATHPQARVAVPQGIGAEALATAKVFGQTPPRTPERVSFVLKARHLRWLEANVEAGMPTGYVSVGQFAHDFGQPHSKIAALRRYLARYRIRTSADADGLDLIATGTAGDFDRALSVQQHEYRVPAIPARYGLPGRPALTIHGTTDRALLPRHLARFVLSILGLTSYPTFASDAVRTPALRSGVRRSAVRTGNLTPEDFARRYRLDSLYRRGAKGAGETVGIVALASVDPADPEHFWGKVLGLTVPADRISLVSVDGGSGPVSSAAGSGETTLDVEQAGAIAPDANVVVYESPNTDGGFVDGFFAAASQNVAASVSSCWGASETEVQASVNAGTESATYAVSFNEAFLELAAQGQSAFVSSGDFGAYTAVEDLRTTNLSAGNPASSPWITTAGGTTLAGTIPLTATDSATIPAQRTWSWDWLWPHYADFGYKSEAAFASARPMGGGGGFSVLEPAPAYQRLVPGLGQFSATRYLTPVDRKRIDGLTEPTRWRFNAAPPVITGEGRGRATPDVSADADPWTGYEEYYSGFSGSALENGWGGTSFVAPQLNGATAVIDSLLGRRVGFWNPAIYRFATWRHSPFTPLDTASSGNDNLYYTGTAGHVFNVGSGLGYPDLARLARDFAFTGWSACRPRACPGR